VAEIGPEDAPRRAAADALRAHLVELFHCDVDLPALDFALSALTEQSRFGTTDDVLEWLRGLNGTRHFLVERKPLADLERWCFHPDTGDIEHDSGGFFAIRGLSVQTNVGRVTEWSQPIIDQAEIGLLGILTRRIDGVLHLLLQAKAEPGNINTFQLSPSVQATRSNFTRVHGGAKTQFLEYFMEDSGQRTLVDQLQSEQGARFFHKRNRNTIVRLRDDQEIETGPLHRWVTLGQLAALSKHDNIVNMDTRSVISCISYDMSAAGIQVSKDELEARLESSLLFDSPSETSADLLLSAQRTARPHCSSDELVHWLTTRKFDTLLRQRIVPLKSVGEWRHEDGVIQHPTGRYFRVLGVRVEAQGREVQKWEQPIIEQMSAGLVGFLARRIDGVLHFLVQAKVECGNMDILELAPTVQCITSNYDLHDMPPHADGFLHPTGRTTLVDALQSEEGGRFFHEANRNVVQLLGDSPAPDPHPSYAWLTLYQLKEFVRYNNYVNVEARSLLACLGLS